MIYGYIWVLSLVTGVSDPDIRYKAFADAWFGELGLNLISPYQLDGIMRIRNVLTPDIRMQICEVRRWYIKQHTDNRCQTSARWYTYVSGCFWYQSFRYQVIGMRYIEFGLFSYQLDDIDTNGHENKLVSARWYMGGIWVRIRNIG